MEIEDPLSPAGLQLAAITSPRIYRTALSLQVQPSRYSKHHRFLEFIRIYSIYRIYMKYVEFIEPH